MIDAAVTPVAVEPRRDQCPSPLGQANPYLTRQVYGYLPWWMVDASTDAYLRYPLPSTIALHSISFTSAGPTDTTTSGCQTAL